MNLFVYGILKRNDEKEENNRMFGTGATFIGNAMIREPIFNMYSMGGFPGLVEVTNKECVCEPIQGELWEVTDETFRLTDAIEGYPTFYNRKEVYVEAENALHEAWVYYLNDPGKMPDSSLIVNGVW